MRECLTILLSLLCSPTMAAELIPARGDPTRPPAIAGQRPQEAIAGETEAALHPDLVLVSPRRSLAFINGQWVRPGDRWGDTRVSRIDRQGVWLRAPDGSEIRLRQAVIDKRRISTASDASSSGVQR